MRVDKCHHVRTNQAVARSPMASYRQALIYIGKPEPSQIERRRHWDRAPSPFRRYWQPSRFSSGSLIGRLHLRKQSLLTLANLDDFTDGSVQ